MHTGNFTFVNLRRLCTAAVLCLAFAGATSANNNKQLKAQAEALLAKSHNLSNLESPGSPPFVLAASVRYTVGGKSGPGQAEIDWLAPDHFRQTLLGPGYSYVHVVQDGKQYLLRTNDHVPLLIYDLIRTLTAAMNAPPVAPGKIRRVTTSQSASNATLTCAETKPTHNSLTACLDDDGDVVSVDSVSPADQSALDLSYQFANFAAFGLHRFPLNIKFQGGDGNKIEVAVLRIAPIENASALHFDAPVGAAQQTWCAEPKYSESSPLDFSSVMPPPQLGLRIRGMTVIYVEVGAGGRPRGATLVHSSEPIKQRDLEDWVFGMRFPVLRCGDDALEYEMEIGIMAPQLPIP